MKKYLVLIALVALMLLMITPVSALPFTINGVSSISCNYPCSGANHVTLQYNATWILSNPYNATIYTVYSPNGLINAQWASTGWITLGPCPGDNNACYTSATNDIGMPKIPAQLPTHFTSTTTDPHDWITIDFVSSNASETVHFNPNGLPYPPTVGTTSHVPPTAAYMVNNFTSLQGVSYGTVALASVSNYVTSKYRQTNLVCNVTGSQTTLTTSSSFSGYSSQFPLIFPNRPAVCYLQETTYNNNQCDQSSCTHMYAVGGSGSVGNAPIADFTINFQTCDPIGAEFQSTSTFSPFSSGKTWAWDFGDGGSSLLPNATHIFPGTAEYNVRLEVSDSFGSSNKTQTVNMSACVGGLSPANETYYYYPVTIIDAITGNAIADSQLDVGTGSITTGIWYNTTSSTGKWNVTSKNTSTGDLELLKVFDVLTLKGEATGYFSDHFFVIADYFHNGELQIISLVPISLAPKTGDFVQVFLVGDYETTQPISGVSITVNGTTKQTNSGGSVTFTNLSAGTHSYTAVKTGYTTMTGSFTGTSQQIHYTDILMSPVTVNPTPSTTTYVTTLPTPSYIPTTSANGTYSGAFGGLETALSGWGVIPSQMGAVLAAILIVLGFILGGFVSAPAFNPMTGLAGASLGFIFAIAFGFLGFIYIIAIILIAAFLGIFFLR